MSEPLDLGAVRAWQQAPRDCQAEVERLRAELAHRDEAIIAGAQKNAARLMELHAELARRDEQIAAVRALCDRLLAQKGWRGVLNMAALHVPTASAHEILAALDGGAS